MGYDIERFTGPVNEGLLCCVCRDVLEDPQQAPCEHAYCSLCIQAWLVHENCCPEDRKLLFPSQLKSLYRYMKNDLAQLQLKCRNAQAGCDVVCNLEFVASHEKECEYDTIECPNPGCRASFERRQMDAHVEGCEYRQRLCSQGCGMAMLSNEDEEHNCIAELRTSLELLRSEMICKMDDLYKGTETRLDTQRKYMVQKETALQAEIEELKGKVSLLMQNMKLLMETVDERNKELEKMELEKQQMMSIITSLQEEAKTTLKVTCIKCDKNETVTMI